MKKIILTAFTFFGLATLTMAQVPAYVPTNGLVGWWPFTGNANDLSGNANNGTNIGASLTTDRFSNINSAYSFNGISNQIVVPDANSLSFPNKIMSFSFWAYCNPNPTTELAFIGKRIGAPGYNNFEYYFTKYASNHPTASNMVAHYLWNLGGTCDAYGAPISGTAPVSQSNVWEHYVLTADGTNKKTYKNGVLVSTWTNISSCSMSNGTGSLTIGSGGGWGGTSWMNGKIDDIGIWNRALTACEITQLYNAAVYTTPTITALGSTTLCSGTTATLSTSAIGSYTWSTGANTQSITVSNAGSYSVAFSNGTCTGNAPPILISVNPLPTISVTSGTICNGQSFTITPNGASTYTMQGGTAVKTPTASSVYTVIGTSNVGCVSQTAASSTVAVNQNPTITVNSGAICIGQSFTMTPSGASTYNFQGGNTTVSPTTSTSYTVIGTSSVGCVSQSAATSSVTVNQNPILTVDNLTICAGQSATLNASGATTYTWNSNANTAAIVVSPSNTSNYSVSGTSNSCTSTQTVQLLVSACTGINELKAEQQISINPNPNSGEFVITAETTMQIKITDHLGRHIKTIEVKPGKNAYQLNDLSIGVYLLSGEANGKIYKGRMVIN